MLDVYALTCISLSYENNIEVSLNFEWFSYPTKAVKTKCQRIVLHEIKGTWK